MRIFKEYQIQEVVNLHKSINKVVQTKQSHLMEIMVFYTTSFKRMLVMEGLVMRDAIQLSPYFPEGDIVRGSAKMPSQDYLVSGNNPAEHSLKAEQ